MAKNCFLTFIYFFSQNIVVEKLHDGFQFKQLFSSIEEKHEATNIYVDGGRTVVEAVRKNLIKRMIITSVPVTLGSGISFLDEEDWNKFELESETKMKNSCIKKVYTPKKL